MDAGSFLRAFAALRCGTLREYADKFCAEAGEDIFPPILVVCPNALVQEDFLAQGAGAVLARPYSVAALARSINGLCGASSGAQPRFMAGGSFFAGRRQEAQRKLDREIKVREPQISIFASPLLSQIEAEERAGAAGGSGQATHPGGLEQVRGRPEYPELGIELVLKNVAVLASGLLDKQGENFGAVTVLPEIAGTPAQDSGRRASAGRRAGYAEGNPLLVTRAGLKLLREGNLPEAERLLRKGLQYDRTDLEAALGLAGICRKGGDMEGENRWLNRAVVICRKTGQYERAEMLLAGLPEESGANPYLAEARNLLVEEAYDEAAEAFIEAANYQTGQPLYALIARTCQFTDCPSLTLAELCAAYSRIGRGHIAGNLYRRLLSKSEERETPAAESFWARFPRLCEMAEVARYTMQAWRGAGSQL
jgi:tetratricopeptide (TPR) repeat protein